jgi:teichuronic acid biosynthesis glycosyltransferase TuaC
MITEQAAGAGESDRCDALDGTRYSRTAMDALVVSNLLPDPRSPGRGSFVRDQVRALRDTGAARVEHYDFPPGPRALLSAGADLRRRFGRRRFDVVHAHFGLSAWPALAVAARARVLTVHGTDVRHPRTRLLTRAVLPRMSLVAAVSASLLDELPRTSKGQRAVLPCGVDLQRFRPLDRQQARLELGLDPARAYVLFPSDPLRAEKRIDHARLAARGTELLTLGAVEPERMPLWINAANAVLVPSDAEGFGLAALEALACDVPVLATPVGIHRLVLDGVPGTLCAPFDATRWRGELAPHLEQPDPRIPGRARAGLFSAARMAERVLVAWRTLLDEV